MKNRKRTFGLVALGIVLAAALAWVLAVSRGGAGWPAGTCDHGCHSTRIASSRLQCRQESGQAHRPALADLRDLSAGGLRSRRGAEATCRRRRACVRGVAADVADRLVGAYELGSEATLRPARSAVPGIPRTCSRNACSRMRERRSRSRSAVSDQGFCGILRQRTRPAPRGTRGCRRRRSSMVPSSTWHPRSRRQSGMSRERLRRSRDTGTGVVRGLRSRPGPSTTVAAAWPR